MNRLKIFVDISLTGTTLELLKKGSDGHELLFPAKPAGSILSPSAPDQSLAEADVVFGQPEIGNLANATRLRWIHLTSAGFTRYDTASFRAHAVERNLSVTNSSLVYAEPCAEHVLAFMLANARILPIALRSHYPNGSPEWSVLRQSSSLLKHQRVVILGFGSIATRLLELLHPFEMLITAYRRKARGDEVVPIVTLEELPTALSEADHVINILPYNAESARFISAERLASMKKGSVFYNIGRGQTVDQEALHVALKSGHLSAAWLDVTDPEPLPEDHPLLALPNCFITPHTGGGHPNESETLVRHFLENLGRFTEGKPLKDRIM